MKELLRSQGLRRLLVGQTISAFGDWMGTVAILFLVAEVTDNSSAALGGVLVVRLLPGLVAGPLAARAASRLGRRNTMLAMDAVRTVMVVLLPIVSGIWWIYIWAVLIEAAGLVFLPARDAALPDLVAEAGPDADLPLANSLVLATSYGMIPFGAGAFFGLKYFAEHVLGLSSGYGAYVFVFLIDALTYLASYIAIASIRTLLDEDAQRRAQADEAVSAPKQASPGIRSAFAIPLVRTIFPAVVMVTIGIGSLFSVGITFMTEVLNVSDGEFVALIACFGVGAALGLGISRLLPQGQYIRAARLGVFSQGAVIATMSLASHYWIAVLAAAGFGASTALTLVSGMSVLQTRLFGIERDLAFAVFHITIRVGLGLAAVGAGIANDVLSSVEWPFVGDLQSERVVMFSAGVLVLFSSLLVQEWKVRPAGLAEEAGAPG